MSDSLLSLSLRHRVGGLSLDLDLKLTHNWTVLFGPSGSGKTTVLRSIAGFLQPDRGRIVAGGEIYFDSQSRTFVPPYKRQVRSAGQAGRLFPHMTVLQNVLYGCEGASGPTKIKNLARQVIESFRIERFSDRYGHSLSGGEQQRACVARALVSAIAISDGPNRPLLLLDEPLSGLDIAVRDELVTALQRWTAEWKIPVLSVTHSLGEAFQLNAEVLRISNGRITEQGSATTVLADERRHLLGLLGEGQLPS